MKKDFDSWNTRKKGINDTEPNFYHKREVRWCSLGVNIGFEQDGTSRNYRRPVLILKGFSRHVCLVIPLTTSTKKNPYHLPVGNIENKQSFAILSQIRLIDTKRLHDRLAILDEAKFQEIKKSCQRFNLAAFLCSPLCCHKGTARRHLYIQYTPIKMNVK